MVKRPLLNSVTSVMGDRKCSTWGRLINACLGLQIPSEAVPAIQVGSSEDVADLVLGWFQFKVEAPMHISFLFNFTHTIEKNVYFS